MASGRPVHPLFGGGGLKNELALKAKSMNARHGGIQETAAQEGRGPAVASSLPTPPPAANVAPVARPPHPLFGGGGGLSELRSAANVINARHGGISETKAQVGKASVPNQAAGRASAPSPARPPHPLGGGSGGMSLQDQIKAKAAKRNARIQASEASSDSLMPTTKPPVVQSRPSPTPPRAVAPSLADQIAVKAAQRKERLGYNDPVAAKPEREGPRPVPTAETWMAPAEKWTSAPPVEPAPKETKAPSTVNGPTKIVTKTEKVTKPKTSKRIIRRKIIKKADGTQQTITTIIDAATGQEINEDGTPIIKPLAATTDYETTTTVTKTSAPVNAGEDTKMISTETITSTSSERPPYMPEAVTTTKQVEASNSHALPVSEASPAEEDTANSNVPVARETTPALPEKTSSWTAPEEKWESDAPVQPLHPIEPDSIKPTHPVPMATGSAPVVTPIPPTVQAKTAGPSEGVRRPAKVLGNKPPEPIPVSTSEPASTRTVKGTVVTTTRTVTTTKTFIPAEKKKKVSLFSAPAMKNGKSKVVSTVTKTEAATREEPVTLPAPQAKAKAKKGWFGRKG